LYLASKFDKLVIVGGIHMEKVENSTNYIKLVYDSLNLETMDSSTELTLSQFMEAYHQTLNEYLNSDKPSAEVTIRLQQLSGPVRVALNTPNDGQPHPAADFIKRKEQEHGIEMEKGFSKVLRNPNMPSTINEEDQLQINGFSLGIIVVGATLILGIILGALLFAIK